MLCRSRRGRLPFCREPVLVSFCQFSVQLTSICVNTHLCPYPRSPETSFTRNIVGHPPTHCQHARSSSYAEHIDSAQSILDTVSASPGPSLGWRGANLTSNMASQSTVRNCRRNDHLGCSRELLYGASRHLEGQAVYHQSECMTEQLTVR